MTVRWRGWSGRRLRRPRADDRLHAVVSSPMRRGSFPTTTMASSTRIPIEKISANSDTRLSVKPHATRRPAWRPRPSSTAAPTSSPRGGRWRTAPAAPPEAEAKISFWISFLALSSRWRRSAGDAASMLRAARCSAGRRRGQITFSPTSTSFFARLLEMASVTADRSALVGLVGRCAGPSRRSGGLVGPATTLQCRSCRPGALRDADHQLPTLRRR